MAVCPPIYMSATGELSTPREVCRSGSNSPDGLAWMQDPWHTRLPPALQAADATTNQRCEMPTLLTVSKELCTRGVVASWREHMEMVAHARSQGGLGGSEETPHKAQRNLTPTVLEVLSSSGKNHPIQNPGYGHVAVFLLSGSGVRDRFTDLLAGSR
ncbi:hypothetical protein Bbelb_052820 [Branchiostoma belcheri]|nr:hypothetical protein Bbelb_429090 [Branchiostoma belcheri]KAI8516701.1 hypothetical protein Bbelb_052820 [Branchiostoma belcheri]